MTLTHIRCGGVLLPIADRRRAGRGAWPGLLVRCSHCRLEGIVAEQGQQPDRTPAVVEGVEKNPGR